MPCKDPKNKRMNHLNCMLWLKIQFWLDITTFIFFIYMAFSGGMGGTHILQMVNAYQGYKLTKLSIYNSFFLTIFLTIYLSYGLSNIMTIN